MKALLFIATLFFAANAVSTFENSDYVSDAGTLEFIDSHFVKDINSADLTDQLEDYLSEHLDAIDHITGNYLLQSGSHYYAVYGTKNGQKTLKMLEVNESLFASNTYYETQKSASSHHCRRGLDRPDLKFACSGYSCEFRDFPCLGLFCPPLECMN